MDRNQLLSELKAIINQVAEREVNVTEETALVKEGILDSLEIMNYLTQIEEVYGVTISLEQLSALELGYLNKMIDYIISNKK